MKIGVNALFLIPGEVGGSQTYLIETLRAMLRRYPQLQVVCFTNLENHTYLKTCFAAYPNAEQVRLKFRAENRFVRILREQFELPLKTPSKTIDVLWSPGYTAPMRASCPQAVSVLDLQFKHHPEDFTLSARLATNAMVRLAMRSADIVLTISEFSKSELLRYTSLPASRIVVTPLAAADAFAEKISPDELQERLNRLLPGVSRYILSVSNSYPHKNLDTLVNAFGILQKRIPHHLVIVGKPRRGEEKLRDALSGLGDAGRCIRLQGVSQQDLIALYQGAELFAFPSLYEGFGLPVLEAMQAGVPVVTTSMAAIPEVGGDFVVYAGRPDAESFAATMLEVIQWNSTFRSNFIAAAKNWAKRFAWENTAEKTMQALIQAAKAHGRKGEPKFS